MLKDFDKFMSQLKETNQTLDFFCDFEKISQNVEDIKVSGSAFIPCIIEKSSNS